MDLLARQETRDIPRTRGAAVTDAMGRRRDRLQNQDALPTGTARTGASMPIRHAGAMFTDTEIHADWLMHRNPEAVFEEQLRSAVVYAARNTPERLPARFLVPLFQNIRADVAERLDLFDMDCHRCRCAVLVPNIDDVCPSCGGPEADDARALVEAERMRRALDTLRASGLVR